MGLIAGLSSLSTFVSLLRHTVFSSVTLSWKPLEWVLSWQWQTWMALWSVVWIFVILKGTIDAVHRREDKMAVVEEERRQLEEKLKFLAPDLDAEKRKLKELETLLTESRALCGRLTAKVQDLTAKQEMPPRLSVSLRTEEQAETILTPISQDSTGQVIQAHISKVTMLIYNHGEKPVRLYGYRMWRLRAVEPTNECQLHGIVTSNVPLEVDVTKTLMQVISGKLNPDFSSLQVTSEVRTELTYSRGDAPEPAPSQDFEIICRPWRGGANLRIEAKELPPQADSHPEPK